EEDRGGWKAVPRDLFSLEANPPKAASDPGYYGRSYSFAGDAVIENRHLAVALWSAKGRVLIYAKANPALPAESNASKPARPAKILEFVPLQLAGKPATIRRCDVLRNAGDEVALEATFSAPGSADLSAGIFLGKSEIVEIQPAPTLKGVRRLTVMEYGVVPSFIGDDLILNPANYPTATALRLPSENFFLGLLPGKESELVMTWPRGKQQLSLQLKGEEAGQRLIESIDFE